MARRIAVAVAGRPGRAGFAEAPGRAVLFAHAPRAQQRIGFGRGPHIFHLGVADAEQRRRARLGIDHRAAEKVGGRAGHAEQGRGDQPAGRGFGDGDRFFARDQARGDLFRERQQRFHQVAAPQLAQHAEDADLGAREIPSPVARRAFGVAPAAACRSSGSLRSSCRRRAAFPPPTPAWPVGSSAIQISPPATPVSFTSASSSARQRAFVRRVVEAHRHRIGAAEAAAPHACAGTPCGSY